MFQLKYSLTLLKMIKRKLIEGLQEIKLRGVDFRSLSSALIDALRLAIFTSNGVFKLQGYSDEYIKEVGFTFSDINSKKLLNILEKFLELISLRTEKFDVLLESSLLHLTYLFELNDQNKKSINIVNKEDEVIETQTQINANYKHSKRR